MVGKTESVLKTIVIIQREHASLRTVERHNSHLANEWIFNIENKIRDTFSTVLFFKDNFFHTQEYNGKLYI